MPYKVIFETPDHGLGESLCKMFDHCRENVAPDDWFGIGGRFYFRFRTDWTRFRSRFVREDRPAIMSEDA